MNLTLSVDDEVIEEARKRAEAMGDSVDQVICKNLAQLAKESDREALIAEFRELSGKATGDSHRWKFNREEIHERR